MIKTLIIMTTYGQIFYSKEAFFGEVFEGDSDISLTAGLISAVYNMTAETQKQKIEELELEEDRSIFRELPGEKLFIITVDKRMDLSDANDMLTVMVDRFNDKYGEVQTDGLILNDFEPIVDEIVDDKLWYNITEKNIGLKDILALVLILFGAIFYPFWFLQGRDNFIKPFKDSLENGVLDAISQALIIGLITIIPISIIVYILRYQSKLGQNFKFAKEYLTRPTRGGYSEMLPNWFLLFPLFSIALFISVVRFGRGLQYGLTAQTFGPGFDEILDIDSPVKNLFWYYVMFYLFIYLLTWFLLLPFIVGSFTDHLSWSFMKSSWIIIGISLIAFLPAHIFAGIQFQEAVGFNPQDQAQSSIETPLLPFLFKVKIPINLFLFLYIFLLGIGMSQLMKKNKGRYAPGFGIGLFITLAVQDFLFFLIFNSDIFFDPLFR